MSDALAVGRMSSRLRNWIRTEWRVVEAWTLFLSTGIGVGLAGRFGLGFVIDLLGVQQDPTSSQLVGVTFILCVFVFLMFGATTGIVTGIRIGSEAAGRWEAAARAAPVGAFGVLLLVIPALVLMVSALGSVPENGPGLPGMAVVKTAAATGGLSALSASMAVSRPGDE